MANLKPGAMVLVEWLDSASGERWEHYEEEAEIAKCKTIGFVVSLSREALVVTSSRSHLGHRLGYLAIPRRVITSLKEING